MPQKTSAQLKKLSKKLCSAINNSVKRNVNSQKLMMISDSNRDDTSLIMLKHSIHLERCDFGFSKTEMGSEMALAMFQHRERVIFIYSPTMKCITSFALDPYVKDLPGDIQQIIRPDDILNQFSQKDNNILEMFGTCVRCHKTVTADKLSKITEHTYVGEYKKSDICDKCFVRCVNTCECCEKKFYSYSMGSPSHICEVCSTSMKKTHCCRYKPVNEVVPCRYCRKNWCSKHLDQHVRESHRDSMGMHTDRVDVRPIYSKEPGKYLKVNRSVGIELEAVPETKGGAVSTYTHLNGIKKLLPSILPYEYGVTHDGSVRVDFGIDGVVEGIEFVTPPRSMIGAEECISTLCKTVKSIGMTVNKTCGVHVHIGLDGIKNDPVKLAHLLRTIYAVEDILYSVNPPSRWTNKYCRSLSDKYSFEDFHRPTTVEWFESVWYGSKSLMDLKHFKSHKYNGGVDSSQDTRYCGVNFHSAFTNGTIEFRHHAGSLNSEKILGWVGLLLTIVDYAENRYNDQHVHDLYQAETTTEKMKLFFTYFDVPEEIKSYVKKRVEEFNPRFKEFKTVMKTLSQRKRTKYFPVVAKRKNDKERMEEAFYILMQIYNEEVYERVVKRLKKEFENDKPGLISKIFMPRRERMQPARDFYAMSMADFNGGINQEANESPAVEGGGGGGVEYQIGSPVIPVRDTVQRRVISLHREMAERDAAETSRAGSLTERNILRALETLSGTDEDAPF